MTRFGPRPTAIGEEAEDPIQLQYDAMVEAAWAEIVKQPAGRLVLWDIMSHCGLFRNPYRGNADTNYACGQQAVAQWILDQGISPSGAHIPGEMMAENARTMEAIEAKQREDEDDETE